jgi:hypothetical protein
VPGMPDTLKTCTREEVWKELNIKYWTNDRIRTGLGIDKPMYHKIYAVLEAEINALGKLYEKINNITAKQALQPGFSRIIKMFPAVFEGVNLPWLEQCLIHWAQRYNNNRKRRQQTAPGRMAIDAGLIGNDALPRANPPAFGNVILEYTRRTAGRTMRCRPRDLLLLDIATMDITLDDLRFDLFLKVLREDIAFDAEIESIYCKSKKTRKLECNTARLWKYALSEMYSLGITTILFVIDCTTTGKGV